MAKLEKKGKGGALVKWDQELANYAKKASASEKVSGGNFIGLRAGQMKIGGNPVKDNRLEVVVLGAVMENAWYKGKFDPESVQSPHCFAISKDILDGEDHQDEMKPHDNSAEPQNEACFGCPMNEFESASSGRGKACGNKRRLAVISADKLSKASIEAGDIIFLKVPVTSVKGWGFYVKSLSNTYQRPPFGMITEISVVPDQKSQFRVAFSPVEKFENNLMPYIMKRREEILKTIDFPYQKASEESSKPSRGGKASPARKKKYR